MEWPEPLAGSRAILSLGDHTIVAQLPAAAMLPAPAPPEELTSHVVLQRLPSSDARQPILEGAFHEVRPLADMSALRLGDALDSVLHAELFNTLVPFCCLLVI